MAASRSRRTEDDVDGDNTRNAEGVLGETRNSVNEGESTAELDTYFSDEKIMIPQSETVSVINYCNV